MGICRLPWQIVVPSSGPQLGDLEPGTLISINENGVGVPFIVVKHDYESGSNGTGRTLVVRKDCYDSRVWDSSNNAYASSDIDSWLNSTYFNLLDANIREKILEVSIPYTIGNGNTTVSSLSRKVFLLSYTEVGLSGGSYINVEGTALEYFNSESRRIAYLNGTAVGWWLRSPLANGAYYALLVAPNGYSTNSYVANSSKSRPAFTLPVSMKPTIYEEV